MKRPEILAVAVIALIILSLSGAMIFDIWMTVLTKHGIR